MTFSDSKTYSRYRSPALVSKMATLTTDQLLQFEDEILLSPVDDYVDRLVNALGDHPNNTQNKAYLHPLSECLKLVAWRKIKSVNEHNARVKEVKDLTWQLKEFMDVKDKQIRDRGNEINRLREDHGPWNQQIHTNRSPGSALLRKTTAITATEVEPPSV